ncbi:hypothetical protein NDU88_007145 [Pleurodeles waltl]|uniref:Uncharacterized protein n=1 Tax=Pleurodeles waltl TaxID=8319 RepID=A0AAV7MG32_PLEWA|nr:hypothetical protein NDU88_007145 [Pleurodeles waltl]
MPSKAQRKQYPEGKPLTSRHSTKYQDAMEPKLHVLLMLVYLLIYQEYERRWGRRPCGACGGGCGHASGCAGGGSGHGAGSCAGSGGGRIQPFSWSLRRLPTGAAAADSSGACGSAGGGASGGASGGAAGGAGHGAGGSAGGCAGSHQVFTCSLGRLKCLAWGFLPLPHLADGDVILSLAAGVLEVALLGGCGSFPLLDAVPLFTLPGGGMALALAGVGGTLAGLTGAPFEPLIAVGTTADVDLVAEVLAWVLATLARGGGWGGGDTLGEDTGDMCMDVGVVTSSEGCVVMGVLVMEVVDEDVVHAGVTVDATGMEMEDEEEGDTVEAVDVGVSAWGWCLCQCL